MDGLEVGDEYNIKLDVSEQEQNNFKSLTLFNWNEIHRFFIIKISFYDFDQNLIKI